MRPFLLISLTVVCGMSSAMSQCPSIIELSQKLLDFSPAVIDSIESELADCPLDSLALAYHNKGVSYYSRSSLDTAVLFTKEAIRLRKDLHEQEPSIDLPRSYYNLGAFYNFLDNQNDALKSYIESVKYSSAVDTTLMLRGYLEIGKIYQAKGNLKEAEQNLLSVNQIANKADNKAIVFQSVLDLSSLLYAQKRHSDVINLLQPNVSGFREFGNNSYLAKVLQNLGASYLRTGDYVEGIVNSKAALNEYKLLDNELMAWEMHNNLARAYQLVKNYPQSWYHLTQSKALSKFQNSNARLAQYFDHLGEYYNETGNRNKATEAYQDAIMASVPGFEPLSDLEIPEVELLYESDNLQELLFYIKDKAEIHALGSKDEVDLAIDLYILGDKTIDELRHRHSTLSSQLLWRSRAMEFYASALALCHETNDVSNAFYFLEKSRSLLLYESLLESKVFDLSGSQKGAEYKQLRDSLRILNQSILDNRSSVNNEVYQSMQRRLTVLEEELKIECPKCFDIKYGSNSISLEEYASGILENNSTALYFFVEAGSSYMLTVNRDTIILRDLGTSDQLSVLIQDFNDAIRGQNQDNIDIKGNKLSTMLLGENSKDLKRKLVIYPSGPLFALNFEVLKIPALSDYVISHHNVRYDYSVNISLVNKDKAKSKMTILGFAPFAHINDNEKFSELIYSQEELNKISSDYKGKFYSGKSATIERLKAGIKEAGILHLSTHATGSDTSDAYIAFNDDLIYLPDIYQLTTNADLVVLSACETNVGEIASGEGVLSLGRAFQYAGVSSSISSLWKVNASSTGIILSNFYDNLNLGLTKPEALTEAKRAYISNPNIPSYLKTPLHWAGLVYYGNDASLNIQSKSFYMYWILGSIGLFLFIVIMRIKARNKHKIVSEG